MEKNKKLRYNDGDCFEHLGVIGMAIEKVGIIGMGAMGMLLASQMVGRLQPEALDIIVDRSRLDAYREATFTVNDTPLSLHFVTEPAEGEKLDLAIFAVKYRALPKAIEQMKPFVDAHTTIISVLNGIVSEDDLAKAFGDASVLYCVAQGMDATRTGHDMQYTRAGQLVFGVRTEGQEDRLQEVADFFRRMEMAIELPEDVRRQLWNKFMFNVGLNQVVSVYGSGYGVIQKRGEARTQMIQAMREVLPLAEAEGVHLTQDDIQNWMAVADGFSPEGKPSLLQDLDAGRPTEMELFSGTVCRLAEKHKVAAPVNEWLYHILEAKNKELE